MTSNKRNLKERKTANQGEGQIRKKSAEAPPELFYKKGALIILQNSQQNTCARASF